MIRRLLAPLTRWLDQRIDVRIAAAEAERRAVEQAKAYYRAQISAIGSGHVLLVDEVTKDITHIAEGERKRRGGSWMGA